MRGGERGEGKLSYIAGQVDGEAVAPTGVVLGVVLGGWLNPPLLPKLINFSKDLLSMSW